MTRELLRKVLFSLVIEEIAINGEKVVKKRSLNYSKNKGH